MTWNDCPLCGTPLVAESTSDWTSSRTYVKCPRILYHNAFGHYHISGGAGHIKTKISETVYNNTSDPNHQIREEQFHIGEWYVERRTFRGVPVLETLFWKYIKDSRYNEKTKFIIEAVLPITKFDSEDKIKKLALLI